MRATPAQELSGVALTQDHPECRGGRLRLLRGLGRHPPGGVLPAALRPLRVLDQVVEDRVVPRGVDGSSQLRASATIRPAVAADWPSGRR